MKTFIFFSILFFSFVSAAEYRAYRLGIKYYPEDKNEPEVEVISNLDNLQYESYYKITPQQQTRIIHHWMCWGRTDYEQDYCAEPPMPEKPKKSDLSPNVRLPASVVK